MTQSNLRVVAQKTIEELDGLSTALKLLLGTTLASDELNKIVENLKQALTSDSSQADLNFVAKWVERGLFDKMVSPKEALEVIAHYPAMPFNEGRWDVDHKPYAQAFYKAYPKAKG